MTGPVGSPYPGTPIAVAFLIMFAAAGLRLTLYKRMRTRAAIGRFGWLADAAITAAAALCVGVILWTALAHHK